jgi:exodeoxyribonuclease VIII
MSDEEKNFKPGIYSIAAERYHAADGVSKSMLDVLAEKTPAHLVAYLSDGEEETEAMRFGSILHRAILEPDTFREGFYVRPDEMKFTTKDGKAWRDLHTDRPILTTPELQQIEKMALAVNSHPFAKRLLAGAMREQSIFVEDNQGTLRKSRLDALTKGNVVPDLKSCESAALDTFERSISRYRYHVQAAYYLDNCNLAGIEKVSFFFICVEKSPPYAVRCLQLMPEVIEYGRILYQRDLQVYRNCLETGHWPGWSDGFEECGLPKFEMRALEMAST